MLKFWWREGERFFSTKSSTSQINTIGQYEAQVYPRVEVVCVVGGSENGGRGLFTESIRADSLGREKARIIMLESGRALHSRVASVSQQPLCT